MERSAKETELIAHMVDLLSAKDPLAYQAITTSFTGDSGFDPSPEAELKRILERTGGNDITAYDEYGPGDDAADDFDQARREIFGE